MEWFNTFSGDALEVLVMVIRTMENIRIYFFGLFDLLSTAMVMSRCCEALVSVVITFKDASF